MPETGALIGTPASIIDIVEAADGSHRRRAVRLERLRKTEADRVRELLWPRDDGLECPLRGAP